MFTIFSEEELKQYIDHFEQNSQDTMWPLLVDRYLPGLECEIDVICDGENIVVPGIFEHIEKAGVHSGDSITVFPPISMSSEIKHTLIDYANKIATSAPVVGMMNIQFVVYDNKVYVLEVNPRSSRTVPIMSKVTGIPMIEWAVKVQLGASLSDLCPEHGLSRTKLFFSESSCIFFK